MGSWSTGTSFEPAPAPNDGLGHARRQTPASPGPDPWMARISVMGILDPEPTTTRLHTWKALPGLSFGRGVAMTGDPASRAPKISCACAMTGFGPCRSQSVEARPSQPRSGQPTGPCCIYGGTPHRSELGTTRDEPLRARNRKSREAEWPFRRLCRQCQENSPRRKAESGKPARVRTVQYSTVPLQDHHGIRPQKETSPVEPATFKDAMDRAGALRGNDVAAPVAARSEHQFKAPSCLVF